jgi:hypothetical protein
MTPINASKLDFSNSDILHVLPNYSGLLNLSLDRTPPVEFFIHLLGGVVRSLRFDDLLEPANSIVIKIGAKLEFVGHRKFSGTSKIRLVDRRLKRTDIL